MYRGSITNKIANRSGRENSRRQCQLQRENSSSSGMQPLPARACGGRREIKWLLRGRHNFNDDPAVIISQIKGNGSCSVGNYVDADIFEFGRENLKAKLEYVNAKLDFVDVERFSKLDTILRDLQHPKLIRRLGSHSDKNPIKSFIAYEDFKCSIDQEYKNNYRSFWSIHGEKAFITPLFKKFLNEWVDFLIYLYDNGDKHGAINDLERCVLLNGGLDSFKIIPTGRVDIDEEEDRNGFWNMLEELKPKQRCPYFNHAQEFILNSGRSFIDTLKVLKDSPLLSDILYKKTVTCDLCIYWDQDHPDRLTNADTLCFTNLANGKSCGIEWTEKIIESKKAYLVDRATRCSSRCIPKFSGLVRHVRNKINHAWEDEDRDNVQAPVPEDEFFKTLYELFPDFYIIIFKYVYCSALEFSQKQSGRYPSEGYYVMNDDFRYIPESERFVKVKKKKDHWF